MHWPFHDSPDVAVFTSRDIVEHRKIITYVSHDDDDGAWQFHAGDGTPEDECDARIVSLQEVLNLDATVSELADLPTGWYAWRTSREDDWKRQRN